MDSVQNRTNDPEYVIKPLQWEYIKYQSNGGWYEYRDEKSGDVRMRRETVAEWAHRNGVGRQTVYDWEKAIPDFWGKVNDYMVGEGADKKYSKLMQAMYMQGIRGGKGSGELWLNQADKLKAKKVKAEVEFTNIDDLLHAVD